MKAALNSSSFAKALWLRLALGLLIGLAGPALPALADTDPPARVGRVSEVIGEAWLFDTENKEWTRVLRNQTIGEGDRLRTDERSRVSVRIGSATVWIDERSDLAFNELDEGQVLLQLDKGDVGLRLRSQEVVSDYRIQTREGSLVPERDGLYRVEQLDRGSRAYVWQGRLRFESNRSSDVPAALLQGGEQVEFWWAGGPRIERQRIEGDEFSDWMITQNRRDGDNMGVGVSQRYVSPEMTGVEDLDSHGRWEQASEFGNVWIPSQVGPEWVPYRDGRWVWTRNWGWSWVDDQPWGFAPFHYGRWVQWQGRWCWSPGSYVARPVYAPALVAWVGGPAIGVGINIGGGRPPPPRYGWYPLAPREPYVPSYRHTRTYIQRINGGDRDPVTVQRPRPVRSNREVSGAISYLPGQGGPARPMPVSEARPAPLLPMAPGRNDLNGLQPQRPAPQAQRPPGDMPWRSENRGEYRGENRGENRGESRGEYRGSRRERDPQQVQPQPSPQIGVQQGQGQPLIGQPQPQPQPQAQPMPQRQPDQPWRGRDRDREPARPMPTPAMPAAEVRSEPVQQPHRQDRPDRPDRGAFERGGGERVGPSRMPEPARPQPQPQPERQVERPRQEMPPMPQPVRPQPVEVRPQPPVPVAAPQAPRSEDRGPQNRGGRRPNEAER